MISSMIYDLHMIHDFWYFPKPKFWCTYVITYGDFMVIVDPEHLGTVHISQTVQNMIHNLQTRQEELKNTNQLELEIP